MYIFVANNYGLQVYRFTIDIIFFKSLNFIYNLKLEDIGLQVYRITYEPFFFYGLLVNWY